MCYLTWQKNSWYKIKSSQSMNYGISLNQKFMSYKMNLFQNKLKECHCGKWIVVSQLTLFSSRYSLLIPIHQKNFSFLMFSGGWRGYIEKKRVNQVVQDANVTKVSYTEDGYHGKICQVSQMLKMSVKHTPNPKTKLK